MVQELIKVNNRNEKELILDFLDGKDIKWASGEEANCERMKGIIPDEFYLVLSNTSLSNISVSSTVSQYNSFSTITK